MSLQSDFETSLTSDSFEYKILNDYVEKIDKNITNEELEKNIIETSKSDNIVNVYVELASRKAIERAQYIRETNSDLPLLSDTILLYILRYHKRFYDLLFYGITIDEYNETRQRLKKLNEDKQIFKEVNELYDNKKERFSIFDQEISKEPITSIEYFFYLNWIRTYKEDNVNITVNDLTNMNDILAINVSKGIKNTDCIYRYLHVDRDNPPLLTQKLFNTTKRYEHLKVNKSSEYYNLYNAAFKKIDKLSTESVLILLDYNNGYFTKCGDFSKEFVNRLLERHITMEADENKYWSNILMFDYYKHLPSRCYHNKLEKSLLSKTISQIRGIARDSFVENNAEKSVSNLLNDPRLSMVLHEKERTAFTTYISYFRKLVNIDVDFFMNFCSDYFLEDYMNHSEMLIDN